MQFQHKGDYQYGDWLGAAVRSFSKKLNFVVFIEKTKTTRAGSNKQHGRKNFIGLKSWLSKCGNFILWPTKKMSVPIGGKMVHFSGDDFEESATRSRDTVRHNFKTFPFPHTDFVETPFNANKPNSIKEFGMNYSEAFNFLASLTDQKMRELVPSSSADDKRPKVHGKRVVKPPNRLVSSEELTVSSSVISKDTSKAKPGMAKASISVESSDEDVVPGSQPSADKRKRARIVVRNTNRNRLLNQVESGNKKLGAVSVKNATQSDMRDAIATGKINNKANLPGFPELQSDESSEESGNETLTVVRSGNDARIDYDSEESERELPKKLTDLIPPRPPTPQHEEIGDETEWTFGDDDRHSNHSGSNDVTLDSDEEKGEEDLGNGNNVPEVVPEPMMVGSVGSGNNEDQDVNILEPQLVKSTGIYETDMDQLFVKIHNIEKAIQQQQLAIGNNSVVVGNPTNNMGTDDVVDIDGALATSNIADNNYTSWLGDFELTLENPPDVLQLDAELRDSKERRNSLVRCYKF
jgi:hypothetical protein